MLQVTVDVFSGRPNPSWVVADEAEARSLLREFSRERPLMAAAPTQDGGLGLRGLQIEPLSDELDKDFGQAAAGYLRLGPQATGRERELAERVLASMDQGLPTAASAEALPLETPLQEFLAQQLEVGSRVSATDSSGIAAPEAEEAAAVGPAVTCMIELGAFNPGFWNNDPTTRARNNCYNYASNKRTNTFAQPGKGCGRMYTAITCAEMTRASLCDGLHRRFDCFPDSEKPRYLVALVVAPGPGFVDFHWYRKQKEGFWGHKPGGTAARNTDNSGRVIMDPSTCDRGPYTLFCGYFYTCRSQRIA
ncbi:hypothetical protein [Roseicella sp. DB1501]|uniref:hypothetical protein n=1 Tax=Roseicella sp. DB1501 TaxID=2730925 RepID=UPI001490AD30|nr:hypothetical protein [Roseicella sp. DB1501]NOG70425.1 hypothetical protein [Roseicella sp. DB1501]